MNPKNPVQNPNRLLVLDADAAAREFVACAANELGYCVAQAANDEQFREHFVRLKPTVILVDPEGLNSAGIEVFSWLAGQQCKTVIVLAGSSEALAQSARQELGLAYGLDVSVLLEKPLTAAGLDATLAPQFIRTKSITAADLRRAVDRAQLRIHYQPKVYIANQCWSVTGIEALLRWDHPEYGLIYPDQFIGVAEQNGLIAGLTDYVLQAGIDQISEWNQTGLNLNLCVNLSPRLVTDSEFPVRMLEFLRQRNVSPAQLTIDVTETAALVDPEPTIEILTKLREMHFGLSLDDFGTGFSPLTQLYKLPFSEIKIDRTFGMELAHSEKVRTIVHAMIELGHALGLSVTCEGVESASALGFLQQSGCDSAQGYYIARPMPQEKLSRWLAGVNAWKDSEFRRALQNAASAN
jgi:EAL domain-containing protein (putative c-di-GMP-specific phosphodiesterase class I)